MLIFDTNVYVDTIEDDALAARVAAFVEATGEPVGLSSVVLGELLVGVRASGRSRLLQWVTRDVDDASVLTPAHADWVAAGDALNQLGGEAAAKGRSFWNDLLIAASCARAGATLVTSNADDFRRIRRAIPVAVTPRPA